MDSAHEQIFVDRAKAGDRAAFAALVDRYWAPLCRWLHGMTGRLHSAEDLTQETFVRAWVGLPGLKTSAAFRIWLFRIARNLMLENQRGCGSRTEPSAPEETASRDADPVSAAIEQEAHAALVEAIQRLPEKYRAAYLFWSSRDFTYEQIAGILEISQENARWRVCEARRILVKHLQSHLEIHPS